MNLFSGLRFKIKRFPPLGLGAKKMFDKNCSCDELHCEMAPNSSNPPMASDMSRLSSELNFDLGGMDWVTFEQKGIENPFWIHDRTV